MRFGHPPSLANRNNAKNPKIRFLRFAINLSCFNCPSSNLCRIASTFLLAASRKSPSGTCCSCRLAFAHALIRAIAFGPSLSMMRGESGSVISSNILITGAAMEPTIAGYYCFSHFARNPLRPERFRQFLRPKHVVPSHTSPNSVLNQVSWRCCLPH